MRWTLSLPLALGMATAGRATEPQPVNQAEALTRVVRPLVLASLPDPLVQKERNWGRQVPSPVGVKWSRLKPTVQKDLRNDGHWHQLHAVAIAPEQSFELVISDIHTPEPGKTAFTLRMAVDVRGFYHFQEWKRGVKVVGALTQARCRVGLRLNCVCTSRITVPEGSLLPVAEVHVAVTEVETGYSDFVCERFGKVHGKPAAVLGEAARNFVRLVKPDLEVETLTKANDAVIKAVQDRSVRLELDKLLLAQVAVNK